MLASYCKLALSTYLCALKSLSGKIDECETRTIKLIRAQYKEYFEQCQKAYRARRQADPTSQRLQSVMKIFEKKDIRVKSYFQDDYVTSESTWQEKLPVKKDTLVWKMNKGVIESYTEQWTTQKM